jgi:acyl-CoA reductase-like NAD-dependent aldehyde dehydrogenase
MAGQATASTTPPVPTAADDTFQSLNPATGEVLATYPVHGQAEVSAAVAGARPAAEWWAGLPWAGRRQRLLAWKAHITQHMAELAAVVHAETGKPVGDAKLEIINTILHLDWAAKNARTVLKPRHVSSGIAMINQAASVEYHPLGVVGVIGPWNYPVFTPMGSIAYALAAGNAVVFKPSELTTGTGQWLVDSFAAVLRDGFGESYPVLRLLTGLGATGGLLAGSPGLNKIAFTGSPGTARKVMAAAAVNLTAVLAECGGKDALLVDASADLEAAADAAAWGAMSNAGQTCVGVERVYVVSSVYDAFLDKLRSKVQALRAGNDDDASYGPMTLPAQTGIIDRHLKDAVSRGGSVAVGSADAISAPYVTPVVLTGVPEDSAAVTEETFGPIVTVTSVPSLDEGIRRANASPYALGSSVFTRSRQAGLAAARALRAGMTSINGVIAFAAVPSLPFGGSGESGFGRIHGADGLREFSRAKAITRERMKSPLRTTTFRRTPADTDKLVRLITLLHGRARTPKRR